MEGFLCSVKMHMGGIDWNSLYVYKCSTIMFLSLLNMHIHETYVAPNPVKGRRGGGGLVKELGCLASSLENVGPNPSCHHCVLEQGT